MNELKLMSNESAWCFLLLQDSPIEPQRYYELKEKDTIKFGNSR